MLRPTWLETDHGKVTPGNLRDQLDAVDRRRRGQPRRLPHRLPRRPRRHPAGHRRSAADRRRHPGVRRRRRPVRARRHRRRPAVRSGCAPAGAPASWRSPIAPSSTSPRSGRGSPPPTRRACRSTRCSPPTRGAAAFQVSNPDAIAQARFAAALEEIAAVGVETLNGRIAAAGQRHHRHRRRVRAAGDVSRGPRASAPASSCSSRSRAS